MSEWSTDNSSIHSNLEIAYPISAEHISVASLIDLYLQNDLRENSLKVSKARNLAPELVPGPLAVTNA